MTEPHDDKDERPTTPPPRAASPPPSAERMDDRGNDDDNDENEVSGVFTTPAHRTAENATLGSSFTSLYQNPQDPNDQPEPQKSSPSEKSAPSSEFMEERFQDEVMEDSSLQEDEDESMEGRLQDYDTQSSLANSSLSDSITTVDDLSSGEYSMSTNSASISEDDSHAATAASDRSENSTLSSISFINLDGSSRRFDMGTQYSGKSSTGSISVSFSDSDDEWVIGAGMASSVRKADLKQGKLSREKKSAGFQSSNNMDYLCTCVWDCCVYTMVFGCVLLFDAKVW